MDKIGDPSVSASTVGWFFDIVGTDEGTCGRRLRVRQLQGVGFSVKLSRYLYVLTHHVRFVQERLLEMSGFWVGLFLLLMNRTSNLRV